MAVAWEYSTQVSGVEGEAMNKLIDSILDGMIAAVGLAIVAMSVVVMWRIAG